jgi:RNA polymerase sigma-70 factor (ECF subfamily)
MNEQQLIEGCRKGERMAQKELYETYSRKMMGVCLRYASDRETAVIY